MSENPFPSHMTCKATSSGLGDNWQPSPNYVVLMKFIINSNKVVGPVRIQAKRKNKLGLYMSSKSEEIGVPSYVAQATQ